MMKDFDAMMHLDIEQFAGNLEELKKEILANVGNEDLENDDAIILEVINVIHEEIAKRREKSKKKDLQSDVRFLAYINLFNTIMGGNFEEDDLDEDYEDFDDVDEEYEELDEDEFEDVEK